METNPQSDPKASGASEQQLAQLTQRQNDLISELVEQGRAQREAAKREAEKKEPERHYTSAELQKMVTDGTISEADMYNQLAYQREQRLIENMRKEHTEALQAERERAQVDSKLAAYRAQIPELADQQSAEYKQAADKYRELVSEYGQPENQRTELLALRIAFPDGDKPKIRDQTSARQRSVETTGQRGAGTESRQSPGRWPNWLPSHVADYYDKAIEQGRYAGMEDPMLKKELEIRDRRRKEKAA